MSKSHSANPSKSCKLCVFVSFSRWLRMFPRILRFRISHAAQCFLCVRNYTTQHHNLSINPSPQRCPNPYPMTFKIFLHTPHRHKVLRNGMKYFLRGFSCSCVTESFIDLLPLKWFDLNRNLMVMSHAPATCFVSYIIELKQPIYCAS